MNNNKPVTFAQGKFNYYRNDTYVQNILLKALTQGVTDPHELKKIAGLNKVADVYRSLDKLSIRKEYHEALSKNGIDLSFIVNGLKELSQNSKSEVVRLAGYQTFLKSLGLDKYEKQEDQGKGWEEAILEISEVGGKDKDKRNGIIECEYEVKVPEIPESEIKRREKEDSAGKDLYGEN